MSKRKRQPTGCSLLVCVCVFHLAARAQSNVTTSYGNLVPSTAQQLPLSGRASEAKSVSATQTVAPNASIDGALLLGGSVNVQGDFAGSVPTGDRTGTVFALGLKDAVVRGLRYNLGAISESNSVLQAQGLRRVARSRLLPRADTVVSEVVQQINLRALGVEETNFPSVAGPFNYFDARAARVTMAVLDFVRLGNLRTASEEVDVARFMARDARDLIVLAVAGSYLGIIATNARIASAAAQVRTSESIHQQAVDRLKEGLNARIDTTRTHVQLQIDRQRLRALAAERDREKLRLSRLIGLPLGQDFHIADDFPYSDLNGLRPETAVAQAFETRADLRAARSAVRAAESALKAARAERLPTVAFAADYGAVGLRPSTAAHGVFTVIGTLTVPLYQGGRVRGDVEQAQAALRQRQAEVLDTQGRIDQEVRQAYIDLSAAADQVEVARSNVGLAEDTLRQARDRFTDGIADTVEVVQAQQSVIVAHDDYTGAVFAHNLAKVELVRAMGNAERDLPTVLVSK